MSEILHETICRPGLGHTVCPIPRFLYTPPQCARGPATPTGSATTVHPMEHGLVAIRTVVVRIIPDELGNARCSAVGTYALVGFPAMLLVTHFPLSIQILRLDIFITYYTECTVNTLGMFSRGGHCIR